MGPFDDLIPANGPRPATAQPAPAAPRPAPQAAPVLRAPPRPVDPYQANQEGRAQSAESRAQQDQGIQIQQLGIQQQRLQADMADRDRRLSVPGADATVDERKAYGFYVRALGAERDYVAIDTDPTAPGAQGPGARSLIGQTAADWFPNAVNSLFSGIGNSPERQLADQSQREFIAGVLRYDSGAAIPDGEFITNARIYFPQPGDGPEVIAQKARARQRAIEGLRASSGRMRAETEAAQPETNNPDAPGGATAAFAANASPGDDPGTGQRLSSGQESAFYGFLRTLPRDAPPQQNAAAIDQWFAQNTPGFRTNNALETAQAIRDGADLSGVNYPEEQARISALEQRAQDSGLRERGNGGGGIGQNADALVRGVADTATFGFSDEIAAAGDTLFNGGTMSDNLDYQRYVDRRDQATNGGARFTGQLAGGLLTPVGRAGTIGGAAREGAVYGGAYGFGSGEGGVTDRLATGGAGAIVGGVAGAGVNALAPYALRATDTLTRPVNALLDARRARQAASVNTDVVEAGARQGIDIRQPEARPEMRADFAALEASRTGNPLVTRAFEADDSAMQARLGQIAGEGSPRDPLQIGEGVQGAVRRNQEVSRQQATALYGRAATAAGDTAVPPTNTLQRIRSEIDDLKANAPEGSSSEVAILESIARDIETTGLTVRSLQAQRKAIRDRISGGNVDANATEARLLAILEEAGTELADGLSQSNPGAANALRTANQHYSDYRRFREEVAKLFVGTRNSPVDPERAADRLMSMVTGKGRDNRLSRIWRELPEGEQADVAATAMQTIMSGRNREFSQAALATNLERLFRENPNGLRTVFGDDGFRALQDLRVIARAKADTRGALNNSRTGVVSNRQELQGMVLAGVGATVANVPGMVAGFAARGIGEKVVNGRNARLMLNPDFTRWLRQMPDSPNPQAIQRHWQRLETAAARTPAFAADVRALQEHLRQTFAASPMRAAAQGEEENNTGQIPPQ